ncbi:MAG: peroxide stress protein YaaA [Saprospiraceae bacterium]
MIILLSPAKSLNLDPIEVKNTSMPRALKQSAELVDNLKKTDSEGLKKLMSISDKIAALNVARYKSFTVPFTNDNAKPAIYTFNGDVYTGLEADAFKTREINFAQKHIRILSGLYGVLRPLDLMQAYRLEMGTKLKIGANKNLYEFWGDQITEWINDDLIESKSKIVLNLASNEYFRSVKKDKLKGKLVNVHFKENRNGNYKVISFNAKKARGRMAHLITKNKIKNLKDLEALDVNGYKFNKKFTEDGELMFTLE